jgi:hypothetical protein
VQRTIEQREKGDKAKKKNGHFGPFAGENSSHEAILAQ